MGPSIRERAGMINDCQGWDGGDAAIAADQERLRVIEERKKI